MEKTREIINDYLNVCEQFYLFRQCLVKNNSQKLEEIIKNKNFDINFDRTQGMYLENACSPLSAIVASGTFNDFKMLLNCDKTIDIDPLLGKFHYGWHGSYEQTSVLGLLFSKNNICFFFFAFCVKKTFKKKKNF